MTYVILIFTTIISLVIFFQFYLFRRRKKIVGTSIDLNTLPESMRKVLESGRSLIYFYSPSCGPCKVQAPAIAKLKNELKNVLSIDISGDFRTARVFGVIGTPSTIIFDNGVVKEMFVGVESEEVLRNAFNN
jgi:thioredoxin 1